MMLPSMAWLSTTINNCHKKIKIVSIGSSKLRELGLSNQIGKSDSKSDDEIRPIQNQASKSDFD